MTLVISKGLTLDNGTRAAAIAGVSPTLDYRFAREKREIETVSLTDKLTYTGGNGTFVGSDGFIQRATTNVPRFDHDPLSRQSLGLLSEVEGTNNETHSEDFSQSKYLRTGILAFGSGSTVNALASPSGALTASFIAEDTSTGRHRLGPTGQAVTAGTTYSYSIFAKSTNRNLYLNCNTLLGGAAGFNLQTGVATPLVGTASIVQLPNNWYRCSVTGTAISTGTFGYFIQIQTGLVDANYTGDGTSGIYFWGAQLEAASTPSTYIPTTSATVTRTADSAVIDGTGVITGTYTMVEKPAGCAVVSGSNIELQPGFTAERVMVFPAALDAGQITAIRGAM